MEGLPAYANLDSLPVTALDQVSFYVPPKIGLALLDASASGKTVGELWLNPGSESPEILARAKNWAST